MAKKVSKSRRIKTARTVSNMMPYGDPIRQAITKGDRAEMRNMAVFARRWIATTEKQIAAAKKALAELEALLPKL
jgi:hypothetical protein